MTGALIALSLLAAYLADTALTPPFALGGARPSFLLGVVTYVALTRRAAWGMAIGGLAGLCVDITAPTPFGAHAAGGVVVGYLIGSLWRAVYREHLPAQVLCLVASVCLSDAVASLVAGAPARALGPRLLRESLPAAAYTAIACPLVVGAVLRLFHLRIRWEHADRITR